MRKGVRSCTHYPISNFVAYDHLSSSVQAFVVNKVKMDLPPDFDEKRSNGRVCLKKTLYDLKQCLKKTLYDLKQSQWAWLDRFTKAIRLQMYK